jgi:sec-independent protein translocase protein TatC
MALLPFPGTAPPYDPDDDSEEGDESGKMSFLEHLDELRRRMFVSLVSLLAGFIVAFAFIEPILIFVYRPLQECCLKPGQHFIYTEPTEAFMLRIKVAALVGLFLALPVLLFQIWRFVAPGLYANEKRFVIPFVFLSTFFFSLGATFSHFVAFPWAMQFFASFQTQEMEFMPRIAPVFSVYVRLMLAMGLVFEMPTLVFFLARIGLVTAKGLLRNLKYAVLVIFIVAAVLTPGADPLLQALMAGPMLLLYLLSIGIAWLVAKKPSAEN